MELHAITGGALSLIWCVYMVVFWGSYFLKVCYSYLQDGDKSIKDLHDYIVDKRNIPEYDAYGVLYPIAYIAVALLITMIVVFTGILLPVIFATMISVWVLLYIMRSVIRLNKRLDKHTSDKDAHK